MQVRTCKGQLVAKDTSCDTKFMLGNVDDMGKAICATFHWVPHTTPNYLFMDNVGGHRTEIAKMEYRDILKSDYNIEIEW